MKIAIIGTGISGLTAAYHLHSRHDITVYEANDYIGGHTATVDIEVAGQSLAVDTGFIVFNDRTYPNFIQLMDEIGVHRQPTQMSFSIRNDRNGLEYNGHTIATLFAQKRNWFNVRFYGFIREILRFNRLAKAAASTVHRHGTLGDFLREHRFSAFFCDNYILPMGAAIWSSTMADMRQFPLDFFLRFFLNHGLLDITQRPQWYVIQGGSRSYIPPLTQGYQRHIRLACPVTQIRRSSAGVEVLSHGNTEYFDQVILACHSDQALAILSDASTDERRVLGAMTYQPNRVALHTDTQLLPKARRAWASWNYWLQGTPDEAQRLPAVTYNMNILQHLAAPKTLCVTLNRTEAIDPHAMLRQFTYHHPVFSTGAIDVQSQRGVINGVNHTWFCGAYWYNGFHEDGVRSALDVVALMQGRPDQQHRGAA